MKGSPCVVAAGILVGRDISQESSQTGTLNIYSGEFFVINDDGHVT